MHEPGPTELTTRRPDNRLVVIAATLAVLAATLTVIAWMLTGR